VQVTRDLPDGDVEVVAELGQGDIFGEVALLDKVPRTRSVLTTKLTTFLTIRAEDFQRIAASLGTDEVRDIVQMRAFLARIPLSRNWHPQAVARFARIATLTEFKEDQRIITTGKDNRFFYVVYEGHLEVRRHDKRIQSLERGDFCGELSLLQNTVAAADVVAVTKGRLLSVHKTQFLRFISEDFLIGLQFERLGAKRLKRAVFEPDARDRTV